MLRYVMDLVPGICISAVFVTVTVCLISMLISLTLRCNHILMHKEPKAKNMKGKKWKTKKIEVNKTDEKKEA